MVSDPYVMDSNFINEGISCSVQSVSVVDISFYDCGSLDGVIRLYICRNNFDTTWYTYEETLTVTMNDGTIIRASKSITWDSPCSNGLTNQPPGQEISV